MILDAAPRNHAVHSVRRRRFRRAASTSRSVLVFRRSRSCSPHLDHPGDPAFDGPIHDRGSRSARTRVRPKRDSACVREAILRRLLVHRQPPKRLRAAGDPRDVRVSFNAHPRMPYSAARTVHIFRRPRPSPLGDARLLGAHRGALRFRSRSVAPGSARIFRTEHQACSAALAASRQSPAPYDTRSRRRPLHRLSPALAPDASVLTLRSAVHRPAPIAWTAPHLSTLTTHRHFRAHVRACFRAYPEAPSSNASSFDSARPRQLRGFTLVHTRVRADLSIRSEHTHCARSYSAYCHRESSALPSRSEPSCSSF